MGLLDGNLDPQTMASLQLAGGLLSPGSFGQGLSRGIAGYQSSMAGSQEMQLRQQQIAQAIQEQKIKDIQLQQQTRMFDLQTPFLEGAVARMRAQSPVNAVPAATPNAPNPAAGLGASSMPSAQPQQAAPQPPQGGSTMFPGVPDDAAFGVIGTGGFSKLPEMIMKANEPTELVKTMRAAGIDPNSALGRQFLQANLAKSNYIAPVNARPGSILRDPTTNLPIAFNPQIPEGSSPRFDAAGNVTSVAPIDGVLPAVVALAAAKTGGEGSMLPFSGVGSNGQPLPVTNRTAAATQGSMPAGVPAGMPAAGQETPAGEPKFVIGDPTVARASLVRQKAAAPASSAAAYDSLIAAFDRQHPVGAPAGGGIYSAAPLGATTTAEESAKDAVNNYNTMHTFATSSAPRNIGLLQSIQQLADKTLVGPGSDKAQFVNGVLNTLGITPGADQAQNYQIMSKNLNMLVGSQRMGAAGGGSDALQSLLQASNPNNKEMNGPALKEASEELIAWNRMMMSKDKAMPNPMSTSPQQYQQAETSFAQFSDPRLWQIEHAHDDQERARILSLIPASERPAFLKKAAQARQLGILN